MTLIPHALAAGAGFFLGSIPTGWLVARARGVDIQKSGSGNIGATNVFRVLGAGLGVFVLVVDFLKGAVSASLVPGWILRAAGGPVDDEMSVWVAMAGGLGSVLGHNYTPWLRFKGGKGIATSAGVLAGLMPPAFGVSLATFIVVLGVWRYVSLASILAALVLPIAALRLSADRRLFWLSLVLSALAVYKHRANISRLVAGTETRIGSRRAPPQQEVPR